MKRGGAADWDARGSLPVVAITHKTSLGEGLGGPETIPSSQILHKMMLSMLSLFCTRVPTKKRF